MPVEDSHHQLCRDIILCLFMCHFLRKISQEETFSSYKKAFESCRKYRPIENFDNFFEI